MFNAVGTAFKGNTLIADLSVLKMFTGASSLGRGVFNGCTNLSQINLRNITYIDSHYSGTNTPFDNVALTKIILPNLRTSGNNLFKATKNTTIIDIGPNYTTAFYQMASGSVPQKTHTYILRSTQMLSLNDTGTYNFNPKAIYVPANLLDTYKNNSAWSSYWSNVIHAIGGEEWVTQFGSSDEYADLTQQEYLDNYA